MTEETTVLDELHHPDWEVRTVATPEHARRVLREEGARLELVIIRQPRADAELRILLTEIRRDHLVNPHQIIGEMPYIGHVAGTAIQIERAVRINLDPMIPADFRQAADKATFKINQRAHDIEGHVAKLVQRFESHLTFLLLYQRSPRQTGSIRAEFALVCGLRTAKNHRIAGLRSIFYCAGPAQPIPGDLADPGIPRPALAGSARDQGINRRFQTVRRSAQPFRHLTKPCLIPGGKLTGAGDVLAHAGRRRAAGQLAGLDTACRVKRPAHRVIAKVQRLAHIFPRRLINQRRGHRGG